ncbi:NADH-quinone oxidoreductase subunit L [Oligoflexia bacterium]|nr:NADH-quinone oxidoreductase subunit L [Oligoflexia bacterium]
MILFLPIAAFAVMALTHKSIARHGDWLATGVLGACLVLAGVIFWRVLHTEAFLLGNLSFEWLPMKKGLTLTGGFMVDRLTAVMLVVVCLVSFLVHLFSVKYMEGDKQYGRYYCGLLLFTASMLGLVLANNMLFLFIFWELVGLSSYLLIGHFFEKKSASDAAIKAFITTRIGDVGMFIGIMICYLQVGSLEYADLFAAVETGALGGTLRTVAGLCIFFGAMGKSAQFPLHVWLPDAMEGPTPVSALIHAATMVAAGVYLVGRLLPLFDSSTLLCIAYIGGFTALFAATIALVQDDIKKVLAYSTVSQLGYMILALGVGGYVSGLFHLTTHAFFKAGLFLGSGAIIYAMHHEQSMSKYGGLAKKLPYTTTCYLLATLALIGFPGFAGFWSKDAILADALAFSMIQGHWFLPLAGFITVLLTAFYMFRQFFLTFTGKPRDEHAYAHAKEVPWQMLVPLIVLGVLAVTGGGLGGWFGEVNPKKSGVEQVQYFAAASTASVGASHGALGHASVSAEGAHASDHNSHDDVAHTAHQLAMYVSTALALFGIFLGWLMYYERKSGKATLSPQALAERMQAVYRVLWNKYFLDELYTKVFVMPTRVLGHFSARFDRLVIDSVVNFVGHTGRVIGFVAEAVDRIIVDLGLVMGSARTTAFIGKQFSMFQTGVVRQYLFYTVAGLSLISLVCIFVLI